MNREIGFAHGAPQDINLSWEKEINGTTYIFTKSKVKSFFAYNCKRLFEDDRFVCASLTGFISPQDFTPQEVEKLPQFADFIES